MPYDKNGLWVEPKPERVIVTKNPKPKAAKPKTAKATKKPTKK